MNQVNTRAYNLKIQHEEELNQLMAENHELKEAIMKADNIKIIELEDRIKELEELLEEKEQSIENLVETIREN